MSESEFGIRWASERAWDLWVKVAHAQSVSQSVSQSVRTVSEWVSE